MTSRKDTIEGLREIEFDKRRLKEKEFFEEINKEFKCLDDKLNIFTKGKLLLDLLELIFYINYKGNSSFSTKCDIVKRLMNSRSKFTATAKVLLTNIYNVRNAFAHNSCDFNANMNDYNLKIMLGMTE